MASGKGNSGSNHGGKDDPSGHDIGDDHGVDDPTTHDVGDDHGIDDPTTHDIGDDHGVDDPTTHDIGDDHGVDDPTTHDVGDDHGNDDPATHDIGDDHGVDDPTTHDPGDDHGVDDPTTHDVGDDHGGGHSLHLFVNRGTQQLVFTDDALEIEHWSAQAGKESLELQVALPTAPLATVAVWRFHDPTSDVYFWTADDQVKDTLLHDHPELEFDGEAFRAFADQAAGGHTAIGVVWDHGFEGDYGRFIYAPVDDAVQLAGQPSDGSLEYLGVAFWI